MRQQQVTFAVAASSLSLVVTVPIVGSKESSQTYYRIILRCC